MTTNEYRTWYYKAHRKYERTVLVIIRKHLKESLRKFSKLPITEKNFKTHLKKSVSNKVVFDMLYEVYSTIGVSHGDRVFKGINTRELHVKARNPLFNENFLKLLLEWLRINRGKQIVSIAETFIDEVVDYLQEQLEENNTLTKATSEMVKKFGSKTGLYKWQIERLVRTETASAANYAAWVAMDSENLVVDKVWVSTKDHRTRDGDSKGEYNHEAMHGTTVPYNDLFKVPNDKGTNNIMYPVDLLRGVPANTINCRCTIAPKPRRNAQGFLIFKN